MPQEEPEFKEIKPTLPKEELEMKQKFFFEEMDTFTHCLKKANDHNIFFEQSFQLYTNLCLANLYKKKLKKIGIDCVNQFIKDDVKENLTKEEQIGLIFSLKDCVENDKETKKYLNLVIDFKEFYFKPKSFRNLAPNVLQLLFTNNFRNKNLNNFKIKDNFSKEQVFDMFDKVTNEILQNEFNELNSCLNKNNTSHVKFCKQPLFHYLASMDIICNKDYIKNCLKKKSEDIENCSMEDFIECEGHSPNDHLLETYFREKFGDNVLK
ncbi:hypothetical protein ABK040_004257 [Willaertia magna]